MTEDTATSPDPPGRRRFTRWLPLAVAVLATVAVVVTAPSDDAYAGSSARQILGDRQLRIMAPAAPGGGWDQTTREMQGALTDLIGRSEVYNVEGAGGTIGLSQFSRLQGDPTQLMTTGLIMLGAIAANNSPYSLANTTPLVRLTTDYQVLVVPGDSSYRNMSDVVAAMRKDLGAVSIAGGSAGGVEQVLAGLMAKAVGANPADVSYVAHSGGGEALSTLLSGRAKLGIFGLSEIKPQIEAGQVRAVAISSPKRMSSAASIPTLRESGVDVEVQNWRGVVAPKGISPRQERALEKMIVQMTKTKRWRDALKRRDWGNATLAGPAFEDFIRSEQRRVSKVLGEIGLG